MTRAPVVQEVRQMRFEELYERRQRRELTMAEAGEMLGVTERTFRRWSDRYDADGAAGVEDRRLGRASARAVPVDEALRMVTLYESRYTGWTVKHVHERWHHEHGGTRASTWTKNRLPRAGHEGSHRMGETPRKALAGPNRAIALDTFGGRIHVEWDPAAAVTPLSQLPFFIEFLKVSGVFEAWVAECPLDYHSNHASDTRAMMAFTRGCWVWQDSSRRMPHAGPSPGSTSHRV